MSRRRPSDPLRPARRLLAAARQALRLRRAPVPDEPLLWTSVRERLTAATRISGEQTWLVLADIVRRDGQEGAWVGCCVLADITQQAIGAHPTSPDQVASFGLAWCATGQPADVDSVPYEARGMVRAAQFLACWVNVDDVTAWELFTGAANRDAANQFLRAMIANAVRAVRGEIHLRHRSVPWP